jgi:hypothetical protein
VFFFVDLSVAGDVVLSAKPDHIQWRGIIIVVTVHLIGPADLASPSGQNA